MIHIFIKKFSWERALEPKKQDILNSIFTELQYHHLIDQPIKYKSNGKPYLVDKKIAISISHTKSLVALAFADQNIGVDLEMIDAKILDVVQKLLTAKELLKFNKIQSIPDRIIFLTKMWTLKEAIIKLKGSGVMRKIQLDNSSYYTHTNFNKSYVLSFAVKKHSEYQIYNI